MRHWIIKVSIVFLICISLLSLFSIFVSPYDPNDISKTALEGPSVHHLFGTDDYGRDVFSRAISGGRISLTVGLIAVSISVIIGLILGSVSGYFGGVLDTVIMRLVDIMLAFPSIFLLLAVQAMLKPSIYNVMMVIGLTSWMGVARLVRAQILSVKERPYIETERILGLSNIKILFRHILPNSLSPVIVAATLGIAGAILTESALSFLGMGVQPPYASWGNMLQDSQAYMQDAPWMAFFPGLLILLTVLSVYFIGDHLREKLDPKG